VLGVTVLTSDVDAPAGALAARARLAATAGCGGLVCAAADLAVTRQAAPGLVTVVPGIRPSGSPTNDQARAATPAAAIAAGADLLVIGRAVTGASDPEAVAADVVAEVAASTGSSTGSSTR
jgi:orotidine-5'-phosphate decarboxylase